MSRFSEEIRLAVQERVGFLEISRARNRLRPRKEDRRGDEVDRLLEGARNRVKTARREHMSFLRRIEREWWEGVIEECEEACRLERVGDMYKALNRLSKRDWKAPRSTTITVEQFRDHFEGITRDKYEELLRAIVDVVSQVRDLSDDEESREVSREIDGEPSPLEIRGAMKEMRDSAPGEDEVRSYYIRKGGAEIIDRVVRIVQEMWRTPSEQWEAGTKVGIMVPLHKKGDRWEVNNFRGKCLLAMGSRILARIATKRLGV